MKKKILSFLLCFTFCFSIGYTADALSGHDSTNSNYLRIFTPYHNVKQTFAPVDSEKLSETAEVANLQRQITQNDIDLMARIVYAESKGEPYTGKVGVASVILNRLYHPGFPKSIESIVYQKNAFSCIVDGSINNEPDTEAYKAVDEAINGYDPTNDSLFFYNPKHASSKWIVSCPKNNSITIGNHVFFK
jgi:Cell wall hydrolyses involved in spore germination